MSFPELHVVTQEPPPLEEEMQPEPHARPLPPSHSKAVPDYATSSDYEEEEDTMTLGSPPSPSAGIQESEGTIGGDWNSFAGMNNYINVREELARPYCIGPGLDTLASSATDFDPFSGFTF